MSFAFVRSNEYFICVARETAFNAKEAGKGVVLTCGTNDIESSFEVCQRGCTTLLDNLMRKNALRSGESSHISNL